MSYEVVAGPEDAARFSVRGKSYAPEEISAAVLRKLADDAGKQLGEKVNQAVITVPAFTRPSLPLARGWPHRAQQYPA